MKKQKGMRAVAFVLAFCLVFHSGAIYAAEGTAETEAIMETQADTTTPGQDNSASNASAGTETQEQTQSDTPAVTETQEQTQPDTPAVTETQEQTQPDTPTETETQGQAAESDPTDTDANAETSAAAETDSIQSETPTAEETVPDETTGSDETVSGTPGTETDETTAEGATEESTETEEETDTEQETTTGETVPMTEPLPGNAESESGSDDIATMMGMDEINLMALDAGSVATLEGGQSFDTLQEAINVVSGNGTITLLGNVSGSFSASGKSFTLDLGNHTLSASGGTALTVTGGDVTVKNGIIDGGGSARALELKGDCTFIGTELTVCNGNVSGNGGGISATGNCNVTLTNSSVQNNTAYNGGGIYSDSGTVTITGNSVFQGNTASNEGGGLYVSNAEIHADGLDILNNSGKSEGGGILLDSITGLVTNCQIHGNSAKSGAARIKANSEDSFKVTNTDIYENTGNGRNGTALFATGVFTYDGGKIYKNNGEGGGGIIFTTFGSTTVTFQNLEISDNTNANHTVEVVNGSANFENVEISGNTEIVTGGLHVANSSSRISLKKTVIKNNTATSDDQASAGGLAAVKFANGGLTLEDCAIYGNKTESPNQAEDVYIGANSVMTLMSAASMVDAEKSFENYVWFDKNTTKKYESVIAMEGTDPAWTLTALEDITRDIAEINGKTYTSLADAVKDVKSGEEIVLVAGDYDEYGDLFTSDTITIGKPVTIRFEGKKVTCESKELFHVASGGSLTLIGSGTISGDVCSEGNLVLKGDVSAETYVIKGGTFTVDTFVKSINVKLFEDTYITATENFDANKVVLNFAEAFAATFNNEKAEAPEKKTLIESAGDFDISKLEIEDLKLFIAQVVKEEENIVLHKSLLTGVYVDGEKGLDKNNGLTEDTPVKTITKAIDILNYNSKFDTIWVLSKVPISTETEIDIGEKYIKRHPSYKGHLFDISNGSILNLKSGIIDGTSEYFDGDTLSLITNSGTVNIYDGAILQNNDIANSLNSGNDGDALGGAIYSTGTVNMSGGSIENCKAFRGGAVYVYEGTFTLTGGAIKECGTYGYFRNCDSAGGGVCIDFIGKMIFDGGVISNCSAGIGGGIVLGGNNFSENIYDNVESLEMSGGKICGCSSASNGGGIYVQCSFNATINGGEISGNHCSSGNFGGGGIYVNGGREGHKNGRLQLYYVEISGNTSNGYGAGIAGCNTSNTRIYLNDGGIIYNNIGAGTADDIYLSDSNGASMGTAVPKSFVSEYMLGGGAYKWKRVGAGTDCGVNYLHEAYVKHLYTNAGDENPAGVAKALGKVTTVIRGNNSATSGGGIGSNGDIILGSAPDPGSVVEFSVIKKWDDEGYGVTKPNRVAIWLLRNGEAVACVEIIPDGDSWPEVKFTDQPKNDEGGSPYSYDIYEEVDGLKDNIYKSEVEKTGENSYEVTNHINCGRLCIYKSVESVPSEPWTEKFKIQVELEDMDGNPVKGPFTVRRGNAPENETSTEFAFADGTDIITLMAGQYAYIDDIPGSTIYKVTEPDAEGYIVYAGDTENPVTEQPSLSGKIVAKQTESAYFRNVYSHDSKITVTKLVTDDKGNEYPLTQSFWVALFEDEKLTKRATEPQELVFDGTSSASVTFEGLQNNKTYYVGELDRNGNVINDKTNYFSDGSAFTVQFEDGRNAVTAIHGTTSEISFRNKVTPKIVQQTGSLVVTKSLTYSGHPLHALNATFYVALYADKECRQRVSDVKALVYEDTISAEVVFDGLEIGVPYYVGECDKAGTALDSGVLLDGTFFRTVFANGNEILLSADKEQAREDFSNEFLHIPTDYYYQGELTVTKHLQDAAGNPKNSNDTFYLGIFADEAHTKLSGAVEPNILTLDMAGHSSATAKVYTRTPDEAGLKLYIAEVDANGAVIQDKADFGYDLTMSSAAPLLTMEQSSVAVSVTNREKVKGPGATEETESETEEYTEIESQTDEGQSEIPESAKAAKTGDETKLWRYLILLVLSAGEIAAMLVKMRRGKERN